MTVVDLHEATSTTLPAVPETSGRMAVQIITPGWGSSGHYSPEVLETAARERIFPAGTKCFLDHPSESERYDRPERSVKDLAAVLTEDARWTGDALVAPVQVFGPYRDVIAEMKDAIGVSIRAAAEVTEGGTAEGRTGRIVDRLVEGVSVDFVTQAGRGGKILQVLESARAKPVERAVRRGVAEATANETRERLQAALVDAYGADRTWVWVRDFDDTQVWFEVETPDDMATWQQAYSIPDDGPVVLSGDRIEVRAETRYVPVNATATAATESVPVDPAGRSTPTEESLEDTMPQIEEARLRQLEADAGRVHALESERDTAQTQRDAVARELAAERARNTATSRARGRVAEANATLAPATVDRIVAEATRTVPLTDAGQLDEAAFDQATDTARTAEEAYLASLAEASGAGRVRGLGGGDAPDGGGDVDIDEAIASAFGRTPKTREV